MGIELDRVHGGAAETFRTALSRVRGSDGLVGQRENRRLMSGKLRGGRGLLRRGSSPIFHCLLDVTKIIDPSR